MARAALQGWLAPTQLLRLPEEAAESSGPSTHPPPHPTHTSAPQPRPRPGGAVCPDRAQSPRERGQSLSLHLDPSAPRAPLSTPSTALSSLLADQPSCCLAGGPLAHAGLSRPVFCSPVLPTAHGDPCDGHLASVQTPSLFVRLLYLPAGQAVFYVATLSTRLPSPGYQEPGLGFCVPCGPREIRCSPGL